jgi:surface antigen
LIGVIAGGCSLSYQLGSFLGNGEDKPATAADSAREAEAAMADAGEENLAPARAAVADALARNGTAKSSAWENPATGARGTITPITVAAKEDSCRDFLASYVHSGSETWLEGEACRGRNGRWEVRRLAPWKRT